MNYRFLLPGKMKEDFLIEGSQEYLKRISKYGKVSVVPLKEESLPQNPSDGEIQKALKKEAERNLKLIKSEEKVVLFDVHGKELDSKQFASSLKELSMRSGSIVFLFGSSYGMEDSERKRADLSLSLSKLTFTHYMAFFLATEQVYRAIKINNGETYDK